MAGEGAKPPQKRWLKWLISIVSYLLLLLLSNWLIPYIKSPSTTAQTLGHLAHWPFHSLYEWTERWSYILAASGPFDAFDFWLLMLAYVWLPFKLYACNQSISKFIDQASLEITNRMVQDKVLKQEQLPIMLQKLRRPSKAALLVITLVTAFLLNLGFKIAIQGIVWRNAWDQRMMMLRPRISQQQYDVLNAAFAEIQSAQDAVKVYRSFNEVVEREIKRADASTKPGQNPAGDLIPLAIELPPEY